MQVSVSGMEHCYWNGCVAAAEAAKALDFAPLAVG